MTGGRRDEASDRRVEFDRREEERQRDRRVEVIGGRRDEKRDMRVEVTGGRRVREVTEGSRDKGSDRMKEGRGK